MHVVVAVKHVDAAEAYLDLGLCGLGVCGAFRRKCRIRRCVAVSGVPSARCARARGIWRARADSCAAHRTRDARRARADGGGRSASRTVSQRARCARHLGRARSCLRGIQPFGGAAGRLERHVVPYFVVHVQKVVQRQAIELRERDEVVGVGGRFGPLPLRHGLPRHAQPLRERFLRQPRLFPTRRQALRDLYVHGSEPFLVFTHHSVLKRLRLRESPARPILVGIFRNYWLRAL